MWRLAVLSLLGSFCARDAHAANVNVNCNQGQTIGAALARLDRRGPNTINVRGTCTESVNVRLFDQLTLRGRGSALIANPLATGWALQFDQSRDVVIRDLSIEGLVMWPCQGCQLSNTTVEGLTLIGGLSNNVTLLKSVFRANGNYAALGIYENSAVQMANCVIETGNATPFWTAIQASGGSQVSIGGTTIRGFPFGMAVDNGARVVLGNTSVPGSDPDQTVTIEDNLFGIFVLDSGSLGLGSSTGSAVRVRNNTAYGISVGSNSLLSMGADADVEVSNNGGGGILVVEGSQAQIRGGARIIGNAHYGVAVANSSTLVGPSVWENSTAVVNGNNPTDVFCDATSIVSNAGQITKTNVTCPNLNSGDTVPLP